MDVPLNRIVVSEENQGNMRTLRRFAYTAFKRYNHSCRGCNFGLFAPSGQGKTYIVKAFAETVHLPFVFVQSATLTDSWMLWQLICEAGKDANLPIVPCPIDKADYILPPMIIFFDEAHAIPKKMMKGGLLNAMEPDDGLLQVRQAGVKGNTFVVDCRKVCWIAATTEKGMLFDAFANRLGTYLEWAPAGAEEVAKIVKMHIDKRHQKGELAMDMPEDVCAMVARYQRVPREAINFAVKVVQQRDMAGDDWKVACQTVAEDIGLDRWGFTDKQIAILTALGQRPIAESRLGTIAKCRIEQVTKYELPPLMEYTNGGPLIVAVSGKGMAITEVGLKELEKRGITHKGHHITAEHFESKRIHS
jgi:AAA+ superfamily predicted ATPase